MASASSILYSSPDLSLTLIDVPRSIEEAQGLSSRCLISSEPAKDPFPSLEPKSAKAKANAPTVSLEDLLLSKRLEFALVELQNSYQGPWCLPRRYETQSSENAESHDRKRRKICSEVVKAPIGKEAAVMDPVHFLDTKGSFFFHNASLTTKTIQPGYESGSAFIPPEARALSGDIAATLPTFISTAPKFSLIVLDPPWPNRSARRVKSYSISYGTPEIHQLLSSIPLEDHLTDNGMIAVWITNKATFREMVAGEGGLFEQWGVKLLEEWIWLKTTQSGLPIGALDSTWRKPYEVLLVGRKGVGVAAGDVRRRVLVAIPDLHSRKPNLKHVFEKFGLLKAEDETERLEIFARNLTTGWWAWGNEVLKFQMEQCWADSSTLTPSALDIP